MKLIDNYKPFITDACASSMRDADKCNSRKQLCDVMLSIRGIPYVAERLADGRIPKDLLLTDFAPFNGRYVRERDGYTSAMYLCMDEIEVNVTAALLVDCGDVIVPDNWVCELHIVGDSRVLGNGSAKIHRYLPDGTITKSNYGL